MISSMMKYRINSTDWSAARITRLLGYPIHFCSNPDSTVIGALCRAFSSSLSFRHSARAASRFAAAVSSAELTFNCEHGRNGANHLRRAEGVFVKGVLLQDKCIAIRFVCRNTLCIDNYHKVVIEYYNYYTTFRSEFHLRPS